MTAGEIIDKDNSNPRPFFRISCPVFKSYDIKSIPEYIAYMEKETGKRLTPDDRSFLECQVNSLEHTYIIFPTSTELDRQYNPIYDTPDVFYGLVKVAKKNIAKSEYVQKNILEWVTQYGLPYHTAFNTPATPVPESATAKVLLHANPIERFLESKFGTIGILVSSFLSLTIDAEKTYVIYSDIFPVNQESLNSLYLATDPNVQLNRIEIERNPNIHTHTDVSKDIRTKLTSLLEQRINGYSSAVTLSLETHSLSKEPYFQYSMVFNVPDLITAVWYQFYRIITETGNLRLCPDCNTFFANGRKGKTHCSTTCKGRVGQESSRKRAKEEAASTQTE